MQPEIPRAAAGIGPLDTPCVRLLNTSGSVLSGGDEPAALISVRALAAALSEFDDATSSCAGWRVFIPGHGTVEGDAPAICEICDLDEVERLEDQDDLAELSQTILESLTRYHQQQQQPAGSSHPSLVVADVAKQLAELRRAAEEELAQAPLPRRSDEFLLRFLNARAGDTLAAAEMLNSCLVWRRQRQVDSMLADVECLALEASLRPLLLYSGPGHVAAGNVVLSTGADDGAVDTVASYHHQQQQQPRDKHGRPMLLELVGRWDIPALEAYIAADGGLEKLITGHIVACEQLLSSAEAAGPTTTRSSTCCTTVRQCVMVMDLQGLSMAHLSRSLLRCFQELNQIDAAMYPELIGNIYVLNVSWIFTSLWALIRPWVPSRSDTSCDRVSEHLEMTEFYPTILKCPELGLT